MVMFRKHVWRLRSHLRNIDRYQSLLMTHLTELELQYLEKRLLEERSAVAALHFNRPGALQ